MPNNPSNVPSLTPRQLLEQASRDQQAGKFDQAEAVYRQILAAHPSEPNALHLLGLLQYQRGKPELGLEFIQRAVVLRPEDGAFRGNLAQVLLTLGREDEAMAEFSKALELRPNNAAALNNLGRLLRQKGRFDESIQLLRQAIAIKPQEPAAYANLGAAFKAKGDYPQAIVHLRQAIAIQPQSPEAHNNLGSALMESGDLDAAIASFNHAMSLRPDFAETRNNLGTALRAQGQFDQAIAHYRKAIELKPDLGMAHFNLGLTLLLLGQFDQGWRENEWRWRVPEHATNPVSYAQPMWDGSDPAGRSILLHAEQGFGDAIHFARYVPLVAERGGRVILAVQPELVRLMHCIPEAARIVTEGDPVPEFDFHCPLLSLPGVCRTTLETIPAAIPYLRADAGLSSRWRKRMGEDDGRLKVGLAWAGRATHKLDRWRSLSLHDFAPLAHVPGARFFSLQTGAAGEQAKSPPAGMELTNWTGELKDFADTAALIENLDLVITVDTAVAHLAGAMGKPAWVLLTFVPDWRWLLNREESPWYPTMRLFRQPQIGDWETPIGEIARRLRNESTSGQ